MEDISDRIARLTQELKALHLQSQWPNFRDANPDDQDRMLNTLLNVGLGHDLQRPGPTLKKSITRGKVCGWDKSRRCSGFFIIQHARSWSRWPLLSTPP